MAQPEASASSRSATEQSKPATRPPSPAFLTKKPGICLTVSAPGFLNGPTALGPRTTNCFPMILISGSSEREIVDLQQGDYEEMDQLASRKPLCKAAFRVLHAADIGIGVARAIRGGFGRPGGVLSRSAGQAVRSGHGRRGGSKSLVKVIDAAPAQIPRHPRSSALDVSKAPSAPDHSRGKGAAYAQADDAIRALVEKSGVPFLPMSMGKETLPDTHRNARARRVRRCSKMRRRDADRRASELAASHGKGKTGAKHRKIIQIDIEPKEMD